MKAYKQSKFPLSIMMSLLYLQCSPPQKNIDKDLFFV